MLVVAVHVKAVAEEEGGNAVGSRVPDKILLLKVNK